MKDDLITIKVYRKAHERAKKNASKRGIGIAQYYSLANKSLETDEKIKKAMDKLKPEDYVKFYPQETI